MRQGKKYTVRGVPPRGTDHRPSVAVRRIRTQIRTYARSTLGQLAGCNGACLGSLLRDCRNATTCQLLKELRAADKWRANWLAVQYVPAGSRYQAISRYQRWAQTVRLHPSWNPQYTNTGHSI